MHSHIVCFLMSRLRAVGWRNGQKTKWSVGELVSRQNGFRRNLTGPLLSCLSILFFSEDEENQLEDGLPFDLKDATEPIAV